MIQKIKISLIVIIIIVCKLLEVNSFPAVSSTTVFKERKLREIQQKSVDIRRKLEEARLKEKVATNKLTDIQRRLYKTQENLRRNKFKYETTKQHLNLTELKLAELKKDYFVLSLNAQSRIRQIFQGQRLRMLDFLIRSPSLTDFLDALYYQKLLIARDRILLEKLGDQSREIEKYKERLAKQKIRMANIVSDIDGQKQIIAKEHQVQSQLVSKLQTERATYERAERELEKDSQELISEINRLVGGNKFSATGLRGTGIFDYPIYGRLTSPFGPRRHPIHRVVSFHSGIDLAAPHGTAVMASDSGTVIFNGWYGGYGKVVIVDHGMSYSTLYAHLSRSSTSQGREVKKGQVIGYEGQTGYSTGPHLHFEVRKDGKPQNPLHFLQ